MVSCGGRVEELRYNRDLQGKVSRGIRLPSGLGRGSSGVSNLQGQFHQNRRLQWVQNGLQRVKFDRVGFWLERDFHAGGAGDGGRWLDLASGEERSPSRGRKSFLNLSGMVTA